MARFTAIQTYSSMLSTGLIPVFYNNDIRTARSVLDACYRGGVRVFEFTNRGDFAHEIFAQLVKHASAECPDMIMGAGSVVDAPTASLYIQSGADFIVGPLFNPDIPLVCNRRRIPYIPGCMTPTEIGTAQQSGSQIVKIFPGETAGPSFVKAVKAPMPWTQIMVTGGVEPTEESLETWIGAGAACVGIGSKIFTKERIANGKWDEIAADCSRTIEIIARLKRA